MRSSLAEHRFFSILNSGLHSASQNKTWLPRLHKTRLTHEHTAMTPIWVRGFCKPLLDFPLSNQPTFVAPSCQHVVGAIPRCASGKSAQKAKSQQLQTDRPGPVLSWNWPLQLLYNDCWCWWQCVMREWVSYFGAGGCSIYYSGAGSLSGAPLCARLPAKTGHSLSRYRDAASERASEVKELTAAAQLSSSGARYSDKKQKLFL